MRGRPNHCYDTKDTYSTARAEDSPRAVVCAHEFFWFKRLFCSITSAHVAQALGYHGKVFLGCLTLLLFSSRQINKIKPQVGCAFRLEYAQPRRKSCAAPIRPRKCKVKRTSHGAISCLGKVPRTDRPTSRPFCTKSSFVHATCGFNVLASIQSP